MMLISAFFVAIVSALVPLVNLELYLAGVGVLGTPLGIWPLAVVAAAGQSFGKLIWLEVGRSSMRWPFLAKKLQSPAWAKRFDALKARTDRRPWAGMSMVFVSASTGLPPLAMMAVVSGQLHFSRMAFYAVCFAGRTLRFAVVLAGSGWLWMLLSGHRPA